MNTLIVSCSENEAEEEEISISDVYQRLASERILFLIGELNDSVSTNIVASLLDLELVSKEEIVLFINSEGGDIRNALMICDTIKVLKSPVRTICIGSAMDEAAFILFSGTKGLRSASSNSVISVSQLTNNSYFHSNIHDAQKILNQCMLIDNKSILSLLSKACGKPVAEIKKDFDRKVFMDSATAVKYGLIDSVAKK